MKTIYYKFNNKIYKTETSSDAPAANWVEILWDERLSGPAPQNVIDDFNNQEAVKEGDKISKQNSKRASMKALKNANSVQDLKAVLKAVIEHIGMEAE